MTSPTHHRHHSSDMPEENAGENRQEVPETGELESRESETGTTDERYLRLAADFENYKRRKTQELMDRSRYAAEEAMKVLLPVLDNLRRAVDHAPQTPEMETFVNGVTMVLRDFETAMEKLGVTVIATTGERFDPTLHEAIAGEEADDVVHDTVSAILQPGYRLHDRVLRPALVRVTHPRQTAPTS